MTPFSYIYDRFLANITDYKLARLDAVSLEENLELWLSQAVGFYPNPKKDLSDIDTIGKSFNEKLNNTEVEALAKFMLMSYMNTHLIKEDHLALALNSKDYRTYSPANQLKALRELKESVKQDATTLVSRNSYSIENLKGYFKKNGGGT